MYLDPRKRCVIALLNARTGEPELELIVYGRTAAELMTVPSTVVSSIASRYPEHTSSPFHVRDF